jgi:hypothetical protein
MFQAANIAKAKQALALCFEESTVEMDDDKTIAQDDMKYYGSLKDTVQMFADTTFITNLPSLDDKTTITMVDEPKMSIFGCLYSYLQTPPPWSLIFGAFTTVYIFLHGIFTLFQANSVPHNSKSVNCLKPKFFKRSFNLFMLAVAVFSVNSIAMGVQVQALLQQVSLYHFPTMTYYLHMYTYLLFVMYFYFRL